MNKKLVLIVDDEKDIRNIIQYNLEQENLKCITASDGDEALKKLNESPYAKDVEIDYVSNG